MTSNTLICQVEEDPSSFHLTGQRGFSVRLSLAPGEQLTDEDAKQAVSDFLEAARQVEFTLLCVDGPLTAEVPVTVLRPAHDANAWPELKAATETWLFGYHGEPPPDGYLRPNLSASNETETVEEAALGIHHVMLALASRPAPFPQQLGLAVTVRVDRAVLNAALPGGAPVESARLVIVPRGLLDYHAPDPTHAGAVPNPPDPPAIEIKLSSSNGSNTSCRTTVIKPLVPDVTNLIDLETGFLPIGDGSDADAHRLLERLEQRGGSLFNGLMAAANLHWSQDNEYWQTVDETLRPVRHVQLLALKALLFLCCSLDTVLLALLMPGREQRDGALLGELLDDFSRVAKKELDSPPSRAEWRGIVRTALRQHPVLQSPVIHDSAQVNYLRDACGLPPLASEPDASLPASYGWLDSLLYATFKGTPTLWEEIVSRYTSFDEAARELDRELGALQERLTSEAGLEATTLRLLRHRDVRQNLIERLATASSTEEDEAVKVVDEASHAFEQRLQAGLNGAQLARQAVGSLLSDLLVQQVKTDLPANPQPRAATPEELKTAFENWQFWLHRLWPQSSTHPYPSPTARTHTIADLQNKLPRWNLNAFVEGLDIGEGFWETRVKPAFNEVARDILSSALAELWSDDSARFIPDPEPRPLPVQVTVDAAVDDSVQGGDDFAAAFAGLSVLLRARGQTGGHWAYANLAQASCTLPNTTHTAMTVLPLPPTVIDGRRQLFVEYRGLPFASRAYDAFVPGAVRDASLREPLFAFDHAIDDEHQAVPALAYGTTYDIAVHAVGRGGALPTKLQQDHELPWVPIARIPDDVQSASRCEYSRTMAIGATVIRERAGENRIGIGIEDVRPLAADHPRLGLAACANDRDVFLDLFRNADGTGAIALAGQHDSPRIVWLRELQLFGSANSATLSIEIRTSPNTPYHQADSRVLVERGSLTIKLDRQAADHRIAFYRLPDGEWKVVALNPDDPLDWVDQVNDGRDEAWLSNVSSAWLRLRLQEAATDAALTLADPGDDAKGKGAASSPIPPNLLLCAAGGLWNKRFTKPAELQIDYPRTTWANVQRWLDNPILRAEWLGELTIEQQRTVRILLQTADLMRSIDSRLPDLLERLPDPAVVALELTVQTLDGLRAPPEQMSKAAPAQRCTLEVRPLGKVLQSLMHEGRLILDDNTSPFELLHAINQQFRRALQVQAEDGEDAASRLSEGDGSDEPLILHVRSGTTALLRVRPLVPYAHFEPVERDDNGDSPAPIIDPRLLQWALGDVSYKNKKCIRFEGAELQVEAMLAPLVMPEDDSNAPRKTSHANWTALARDAIRHLPAPSITDSAGAARSYELSFDPPGDQWRWKQLGWIEVETQRWRFTGRPIQHWFKPEPRPGAEQTADSKQASFEVEIKDDVLKFMADAFDNRSDLDSVAQRTPLLPLPAVTTLQRVNWEKPSATMFRHRVTLRSRYSGALAHESDGRCPTWDVDAGHGLADGSSWRAFVMLADLDRIELNRPQLRALMPLTSAPGKRAPGLLAILQERPYDVGGLAERVTAEARTGVGYEASTDQTRPLDLRKEAGLDPRLSYQPMDETLAQSLVLSPLGPIGLTFDDPKAQGQAFPNTALMLHPGRLGYVAKNAVDIKPERMEEAFVSVVLRRHLDPAWLVPRTRTESPENLPIETSWWFEWERLADDADDLLLLQMAKGGSALFVTVTRESDNEGRWLVLRIEPRLIDETIPVGQRPLRLARVPDAGRPLVLMHQPHTDRLATLAVLMAPVDDVAHELVASIQWSVPKNLGAVTLAARGTCTAQRTNTSLATEMRWGRIGRDFNTVFVGPEPDSPGVSVEDLTATLKIKTEAAELSLKHGNQQVWVRSRQSAQRFPSTTQRHVAVLYSHFIRGLGRPTEQLLGAGVAEGRSLSLSNHTIKAERLRLIEFELPSRPFVFMPNGATVPEEFRCAYHDLVAIGAQDPFDNDENPTGKTRWSIHIRLIGTGNTLQNLNSLTLKLELLEPSPEGNHAWGVSPLEIALERPAEDQDSKVHALVFEFKQDLAGGARQVLVRWINDQGDIFPCAFERPLTVPNGRPMGLRLSLTEVRLGDDTQAELWGESALLVSPANSEAGFGGRIDFDWFFGSQDEIKPESAVRESALRSLTEAQARLIAVSPPKEISRD